MSGSDAIRDPLCCVCAFIFFFLAISFITESYARRQPGLPYTEQFHVAVCSALMIHLPLLRKTHQQSVTTLPRGQTSHNAVEGHKWPYFPLVFFFQSGVFSLSQSQHFCTAAAFWQRCPVRRHGGGQDGNDPSESRALPLTLGIR